MIFAGPPKLAWANPTIHQAGNKTKNASTGAQARATLLA